MSVFLTYFIGFDTINFYIFSLKWAILDQTYSFKNKELLTVTKIADTLLYSSVKWNSYKISMQTGKPFWYWRSGNIKPMIFTYFASSSPFAATLLKRLQYRCFPVKFAKFLRTPCFYRTPPVTASAFVRLTHALLIRLIRRDPGTCIFLWILRNLKKHCWPPPVAASSSHKMQNIKIHHDNYMQ